MSRAGFLSTVAIVLAFAQTGAEAQSLRNSSGPAELPPASFTGNQYVDSRGCVFIRAGIGGTTTWVPRVNRNRELLCGFSPTLAPRVSPPAPLPEPEPQRTAEATTGAPAAPPEDAPIVTAVRPATPAPARPAAAAPAPARSQQASVSPRVITPPAAPAPAAVPARAEPRTITRAEACAGRTGIQPGFISQRTGQPIDCGGVPESVRVAAPAAPAVPTVRTPAAPVRTAADLAGPQRPPLSRVTMTLAEICADQAATGRRYIRASTGQPFECGPTAPQPTLTARVPAPVNPPVPQVQPQTAALASARPTVSGIPPVGQRPTGLPGGGVFERIRVGLSAPQVPYSNPLDGAPGSTYMPINRGTHGQVASGVPGMGTVNTPTAAEPTLSYGTVTRSATSPATTGLAALINPPPPPYSNPVGAPQRIQPTPPEGYQAAWDDGRLNPNRGLPGRTVRYATQATPEVQQPARVSTRSAPQTTRPQPAAEAISGQRYVQVGTFADRGTAQGVAQALRGQGLPMRIGVYERGGVEYRIVLAGPFASANQVRSALNTVQGAGYSGAFARN